MAAGDLTDKQAAQTIKIAGAASGGIESNFAEVSDRQRLKTENEQFAIARADVASQTVTVTGQSAALESLGAGLLNTFLEITAISGTTPTFQLLVDVSEDGTNWSAMNSTGRLTTTGLVRIPAQRLSGFYYRYRWILTGTSPSVTFKVTSSLKNYLPPRSLAIAYYDDLSLTTVGNMSTVVSGSGISNLTLQMVRIDDGGNGGSVRIQASNDGVLWADLTGNIGINKDSITLQQLSSQAWSYYRVTVTAATNPGSRVVTLIWGGR